MEEAAIGGENPHGRDSCIQDVELTAIVLEHGGRADERVELSPDAAEPKHLLELPRPQRHGREIGDLGCGPTGSAVQENTQAQQSPSDTKTTRSRSHIPLPDGNDVRRHPCTAPPAGPPGSRLRRERQGLDPDAPAARRLARHYEVAAIR